MKAGGIMGHADISTIFTVGTLEGFPDVIFRVSKFRAPRINQEMGLFWGKRNKILRERLLSSVSRS